MIIRMLPLRTSTTNTSKHGVPIAYSVNTCKTIKNAYICIVLGHQNSSIKESLRKTNTVLQH